MEVHERLAKVFIGNQACSHPLLSRCHNCTPLEGKWGFPGGSDGKESAYNTGDLRSIPWSEDPLEKGMAVGWCTSRWHWASQVLPGIKNLPATAGDIRDMVRFLGCEDPLEKGMATHSNILAWRITWREEPGRLQSMGSQRVRHD